MGKFFARVKSAKKMGYRTPNRFRRLFQKTKLIKKREVIKEGVRRLRRQKAEN